MSAPARSLERLTRVTPLGLRFWDEAAGAVVFDGLVVEVYPIDAPDRRVTAHVNRVGTFVAASLGGPRDPDFDFGEGDDAFWSRVRTRRHAIEVRDASGRFQPFWFEHSLPARGLVVPGCLPQPSPPLSVLPLHSTASRPVPAGMAVIRADLRYPTGSRNGSPAYAPAAWAVLEAHVAGQPPVRGLADRDGRVAVVFPYPEPAAPLLRPASPPASAGQGLVDQEWNVRLDAFFEVVTPVPEIPDLCRALSQAPALLWADRPDGRLLGDQVLRYGRELIVRSDGAEDPSTLVVTPAGSPP